MGGDISGQAQRGADKRSCRIAEQNNRTGQTAAIAARAESQPPV